MSRFAGTLADELKPYVAPFRVDGAGEFHLKSHKTGDRGGLDKEAGETQARRAGVAGEIPADLLALYTKLKDQYGVGAAMLRGGRCQGCKVALSIAEMNRIKAAPHDEVLRCDECRRILVRTPESGL